MRVALLTMSLFLLPAVAAVDRPTEPRPTPLMRTVEPRAAKPGMEVVVAGDHLGKNLIAEIFLTANDQNFKVEILGQTDRQVRFKVPEVKGGTYKILVLLTTVDPILIEEPVRLVVEE